MIVHRTNTPIHQGSLLKFRGLYIMFEYDMDTKVVHHELNKSCCSKKGETTIAVKSLDNEQGSNGFDSLVVLYNNKYYAAFKEFFDVLIE